MKMAPQACCVHGLICANSVDMMQPSWPGPTITMAEISSPFHLMGANFTEIYELQCSQGMYPHPRYKYLRQRLPDAPHYLTDQKRFPTYSFCLSLDVNLNLPGNALALPNSPPLCPQCDPRPRRAGGDGSLEWLNLQHSRPVRRERLRRRLLARWTERRANLQRSIPGRVQPVYLRGPGIPA